MSLCDEEAYSRKFSLAKRLPLGTLEELQERADLSMLIALEIVALSFDESTELSPQDRELLTNGRLASWLGSFTGAVAARCYDSGMLDAIEVLVDHVETQETAT